MYGFIANEETSVLPAIEEQHHGSMFIFISTKAEANWMQVAPTTQLGAGASFFFVSSSSVDIVIEGAAFALFEHDLKGWLPCFVGRGLLIYAPRMNSSVLS